MASNSARTVLRLARQPMGSLVPDMRLCASFVRAGKRTPLSGTSSSSSSFSSSSSPLYQQVRFAHRIPRPRLPSAAAAGSKDTAKTQDNNNDSDSPKPLAPYYELTFTCVPCGERSAHRVTKQGYHHGSVLIACPGCHNRHVISDHLGIFGAQAKGGRSLEDILAAKGQIVKKGTLGEAGDVEFWEDGTESVREKRMADERVTFAKKKEKKASTDPEEADKKPPGWSFAKKVE